MDAYTYVLDDDLTIVDCSDNWDAFAYENHGHQTLCQDVVGTNLMQWISGEETRRLYREALAGIPVEGDTHVLPFRCDSHDARRSFECCITRFRLGYVFCNTLIDTRPLGFSLAWVHARGREAVGRCSICGRFRLEGRWRAPEDLAERAVRGPIRVAHTVCDGCALLGPVRHNRISAGRVGTVL